MFKVAIEDVIPGVVVEQDIFLDPAKGDKGLPLLVTGQRITADFIYRLKKRGVTSLFTSTPMVNKKKSSVQRTFNPISGLYHTPKTKPTIAPKTKDEVLKTMKDFEISLSGLDADDVFEIVNNLGDVLNRVLKDFPENLTAPINIHQLRGDDKEFYIYKHALSVSVISMAIGQYLSLPRADVLELGKCASMHDIGMFLVSPDILYKDKKLNRDELESVKRHTQLGYHSLVKMDIVDDTTRDGILYHHERIDGTGYPLGLKGEDIPLWSRIIAVADVYDAMTSYRAYRQPRTPAEACEFIMGSANSSFEYDIVSALLKRIDFYPVGTSVKLSNGNYAVVTENTKSKLRPTIKILNTDIIIDLNDRKYYDVTILRSVSYQDIIEGK